MRFLFLAALLVLPTFGSAQSLSPIKASISSPQMDQINCPRTEARLAVLGDSLADGLWAAISRAFERCSTVDVLRLTQVSDGLARSTPEEWIERFENEARDTAAQDVVVVQIGANDLVNMRDNRRRIVYGTDDWDPVYSDRITRLAGLLNDRSDSVLWIGLPVTGSQRIEPHYARLNALLSGSLQGADVSFFDIRELSRFGADTFVMNAEIDGRSRQVRAPDQVHFTFLGYELIAEALVPDIRAAMEATERQGVFGTAPLQ